MDMETTVKASADQMESASLPEDLPRIPDGCSYPENYELSVELPEVGPLCIRPIRAYDAASLEELFKTLTPHSVYLRFFSFIRQLPPDMLARFTRIDYSREIALVALSNQEGKEEMVGDARVVATDNEGSAEFSVMVSQPLQGKGIGACLLANCLAIAHQRGFRRIYGLVLAENRQMLALGRKLGFAIKHLPGSTEYELSRVFF